MVCTRTAANAIAANSSTDPIVLTVAVAAAAVPSKTNTVIVSGGNEPANNQGNNTKTDLTNVYVTPTISKAFATNPVVASLPSKLTLTIINPGTNSVALADLAINDPFPAGMSVAPTPNFSNSCGGTVSPGPEPGRHPDLADRRHPRHRCHLYHPGGCGQHDHRSECKHHPRGSTSTTAVSASPRPRH